MTDTTATPHPITCPKCATNKAGKLTCCARGGSWFRKCGDSGDYTWAEGLKACKDSASGKAQAHAMLFNQTTTDQEQKDVAQKHLSVTVSVNGVYGAGTVNSNDCDKRSCFVVVISVLFTTLLLHI